MTIVLPKPMRDSSGYAPPLTEAQRAKIVTVDLDKLPHFIGVVRDLAETHAIVHAPAPGKEAWVYRRDWGDLAKMFDRRKRLNLHGYCRTFYESHQVHAATAAHVRKSLTSRQALAFMKNLQGMCDEIAGHTHSRAFTLGIDFEYHRQPSDIHVDRIGLRAFMATEHGNLILPDMRAARAAGFAFSADTAAMNDSWNIVELIEAGVPVYSTALGDITFLRGTSLPGVATWHAAHQLRRPHSSVGRPVMKADFEY